MAIGTVLGVGEARIEQLLLMERHPEAESTIDLDGFSLQGGGTASTALATLAALGVPTRFIGKVADDFFGRFVLNGLAAIGVDTRGVVTQADCVSPSHIVLVEAGRGRQTVLRAQGTVAALALDELPPEPLAGVQLLLVDGAQPAVALELIARARRAGVPVVLDASGPSSAVAELTASVDVVIATERYLVQVAPRGELEASMQAVARLGPRTVIVTMGREGSVGLQGDKLVRQPPLPVEVVDTTGAGDVFLGGYCYGLLQELPLERCMELASAAAGLSCRAFGPRSGLPSRAELQAALS
ncbi:MAG: hypothetical protein IPL40_15940 [Proteobacteria bacterium]|nr:hypothetical protein [Pseudomonadota bacterium]